MTMDQTRESIRYTRGMFHSHLKQGKSKANQKTKSQTEEEKETEYLARGGVSDSKAYQTETVVGVVFMYKKKKKHKWLR